MTTATVYSADELRLQGFQVNRCVCGMRPELFVPQDKASSSKPYVSCLCGRRGDYGLTLGEAVRTWNEDSPNVSNTPAFERIVALAVAWG
jgi:hypothetical protein